MATMTQWPLSDVRDLLFLARWLGVLFYGIFVCLETPIKDIHAFVCIVFAKCLEITLEPGRRINAPATQHTTNRYHILQSRRRRSRPNHISIRIRSFSTDRIKLETKLELI